MKHHIFQEKYSDFKHKHKQRNSCSLLWTSFTNCENPLPPPPISKTKPRAQRGIKQHHLTYRIICWYDGLEKLLPSVGQAHHPTPTHELYSSSQPWLRPSRQNNSNLFGKGTLGRHRFCLAKLCACFVLLLSLHLRQNATKYPDATIQGNRALWFPRVALGSLLFKLYCWKKEQCQGRSKGLN